MSQDELAIAESPWPVPAGVQEADPAERIADDLRRIKRLRDLIRDQRTNSREALRVLLLKLLEVDDALDRILSNTPDPNSPSEVGQWNSIRVTRRLLAQALRLQNVTPVELLGRPADPLLCEVETWEERSDLPDETVVRELVKGYRWGDEAVPLRPAVVVIACQSAQSEKDGR